MNLLVTVLSTYNIHVSTHVCVNKHVFLGVYGIKNDIIKENLLQEHFWFMCVSSYMNMLLYCNCVCVLCHLIVLTVCLCGVLWICVVLADSGPPPGVCERSADATSGQDNAHAAPTLPPAL